MVAKKTATYSLMHLVVAFIVAYLVSGDLRIAIGISLIEPVAQTICYAIHEHLWNKKSLRDAMKEGAEHSLKHSHA